MKPPRSILIYIAGPYRGASESDVFANIMRARTVAIQVWKAGFTAICPHLNTMFFGGVVKDDVILESDLFILSRCDAVLVLDGWEASAGTKSEIGHANDNGIPVFFSLYDLLGVDDLPHGASSFSLNPFGGG